MDFSNTLLRWYEENQRTLPWRNETDPYKIWVSEIILQQTQVRQGWNYYLDFIANFPNISELAAAPLEKVLKVWQGLGYYSRARNMHRAATLLQKTHNAQFPKDYDDIIALPGIGEYTAAAIASFAFGLPYATVDGNVQRVICRFYGYFTDIATTKAKHEIRDLCRKLLDNHNPAEFNQAMMEFGALQCTPKSPNCTICPLKNDCFAHKNDQIPNLPVKKTKGNIKTRHFHYFLFTKDAQIVVQQRVNNDIWQNLYEFPMVETAEKNFSVTPFLKKQNITSSSKIKKLATITQRLTHQQIASNFYLINIDNFPQLLDNQEVINITEWKNFAVPKTIETFNQQFLYPYFNL